MITLNGIECTPYRKSVSPRYFCGVEEENEVADKQEDQDTQIR